MLPKSLEMLYLKRGHRLTVPVADPDGGGSRRGRIQTGARADDFTDLAPPPQDREVLCSNPTDAVSDLGHVHLPRVA